MGNCKIPGPYQSLKLKWIYNSKLSETKTKVEAIIANENTPTRIKFLLQVKFKNNLCKNFSYIKTSFQRSDRGISAEPTVIQWADGRTKLSIEVAHSYLAVGPNVGTI